MNKKVIVTALVLGGAIVYALRKLTQSKKAEPAPQAAKHGTHHLTNVFSRAKTMANHVS